jgi:hypothetical protein
MNMPAFPALQSRYRSFTSRRSNQAGFFQNHPISDVARSLFVSSILWLVLAIALYGVYSIVVGTV